MTDRKSKWDSPSNVTHWAFFLMGFALGVIQTWLILR